MSQFSKFLTFSVVLGANLLLAEAGFAEVGSLRAEALIKSPAEVPAKTAVEAPAKAPVEVPIKTQTAAPIEAAPVAAVPTMTLKDAIAFGNEKSPLEVYVFTDWKCPACRSIEPAIEASAPEIMEKAKLIFIDFIAHQESLNYVPYNLSFMLYDKDKYFKLRDALLDFSAGDKPITDEEIAVIAKKNEARFMRLSFSDVSAAVKYFELVTRQFNVERTPTIVVINSNTKKGKVFSGVTEISSSGILKALDELKDAK